MILMPIIALHRQVHPVITHHHIRLDRNGRPRAGKKLHLKASVKIERGTILFQIICRLAIIACTNQQMIESKTKKARELNGSFRTISQKIG